MNLKKWLMITLLFGASGEMAWGADMQHMDLGEIDGDDENNDNNKLFHTIPMPDEKRSAFLGSIQKFDRKSLRAIPNEKKPRGTWIDCNGIRSLAHSNSAYAIDLLNDGSEGKDSNGMIGVPSSWAGVSSKRADSGLKVPIDAEPKPKEKSSMLLSSGRVFGAFALLASPFANRFVGPRTQNMRFSDFHSHSDLSWDTLKSMAQTLIPNHNSAKAAAQTAVLAGLAGTGVYLGDTVVQNGLQGLSRRKQQEVGVVTGLASVGALAAITSPEYNADGQNTGTFFGIGLLSALFSVRAWTAPLGAQRSKMASGGLAPTTPRSLSRRNSAEESGPYDTSTRFLKF
jgi:hypothetical protein